MKVYSYVVCHDKGFAPNPFWGYCTLAVCTPNHMGIDPQIGDWIIGTESVDKGNKLIYAMQVSSRMSFDQYYADKRFEKKKPNAKSKDWRKHCGDNFYYKDKSDRWEQQPFSFHDTPENKRQDLKHPYVFIAKHFYYFGRKAKIIPSRYSSLILKRQGVKCKHAPKIAEGFLVWLQNNFKPGIHGEPRDCESKPLKCSEQTRPCADKCAL